MRIDVLHATVCEYMERHKQYVVLENLAELKSAIEAERAQQLKDLQDMHEARFATFSKSVGLFKSAPSSRVGRGNRNGNISTSRSMIESEGKDRLHPKAVRLRIGRLDEDLQKKSLRLKAHDSSLQRPGEARNREKSGEHAAQDEALHSKQPRQCNAWVGYTRRTGRVKRQTQGAAQL